jgi:arsenate reductase
MAEGMLRAWGGAAYEVRSAGTEATSVRPQAIAVMDELGIDLRTHTSEHLGRYLGESFDWVITVCDDARESCPVFPGARAQEHWSFEDPSAAIGTDDERLEVFRRVRDEIAARIREFLRRREEPVMSPPSPPARGSVRDPA